MVKKINQNPNANNLVAVARSVIAYLRGNLTSVDIYGNPTIDSDASDIGSADNPFGTLFVKNIIAGDIELNVSQITEPFGSGITIYTQSGTYAWSTTQYTKCLAILISGESASGGAGREASQSPFTGNAGDDGQASAVTTRGQSYSSSVARSKGGNGYNSKLNRHVTYQLSSPRQTEGFQIGGGLGGTGSQSSYNGENGKQTLTTALITGLSENTPILIAIGDPGTNGGAGATSNQNSGMPGVNRGAVVLIGSN